MNKLRIHHIGAKPILLLIAFAHLGFHPGLDCCHCLVEGAGDHLLDDLILIYSQI
jgi:hypothetical protein